jgi:hypothetical protein
MKLRHVVAALVLCGAVVGAFSARPAAAVKPYLAQFKALYVKAEATDRTAQIFKEAVEKKGCTICHRGQPAKPTKGFNSYGARFRKLLNAKCDAQDPRKIRAAMAKVARMKSDPDDPDSPTFGQRLKEGKLPVGEIHVRPAGTSE